MAVGYLSKRIKNLPTGDDPNTNRIPAQKYKSVFASWHPNKLLQFEKDVIAGQMSLRAIGEKYGVSSTAVSNYRDKTLTYAIKMAKESSNVDVAEHATKFLAHLFGEIDDSIDEVKGRKKDKDGNSIKGDTAIHGNVIALLGMGIKAVQVALPAATPAQSQAQQAQGAVPQIVNIISIPKAPGTPERGRGIKGAVDYSRVKVLDLESEKPEQV